MHLRSCNKAVSEKAKLCLTNIIEGSCNVERMPLVTAATGDGNLVGGCEIILPALILVQSFNYMLQNILSYGVGSAASRSAQFEDMQDGGILFGGFHPNGWCI